MSLRFLTILSGAVEAVFGLSALILPGAVGGTLGDASAVTTARLLGAATLSLGLAALMARNELRSVGGLAIVYGLTCYNLLAAALILWTVAVTGQGGPVFWGGGIFHMVIGILFVYALVTRPD
jgi:hypothetical protein